MLKQTRKNLRTFVYFIKKYRFYYIVGSLAVLGVDFLEIFPPLILKNVIDQMTTLNATATFLLTMACLYVSVAAGQALMRYLWRMFLVRTSMRAGHDMRVQLYNHLTTLSPGFFKKKRVGDLVSLNSNDIEMVRFALGPGFLIFIDCFCYFITIPPIMFYLSPKLALVTLAPMMLVPIIMYKMERLIHDRYKVVQDRFADLSSHGQESLMGVRVVKGNALETRKEKEFSVLGLRYIKANLRSRITESSLTMILEFVISISITLLFVVGGLLVIQESITIGAFVAFQRYINRMVWPMEGLGLAVLFFERAFAAEKRLQNVRNVKPEINRPKEDICIKGIHQPQIELRNFTFTYPGDSKPTLKNINLHIEPGKKIGIVGRVGSGKSTLLACIARLEAVPREMIFFDGIDINDIDPTLIRKKIALVSQEPFLFSESVENNIVYGNSLFESKISEKERASIAWHAAESAKVRNDLKQLPDKLKTVLGERGVNLSGGQKQRLTIARAIAQETDILMFDDCLSAVDSETESALVDTLDVASSGKTLILTSHRFSSLEKLNQIIVLDEGEVVENDSPENLLATGTAFRSIFYRQLPKHLQMQMPMELST